MYRSPPTATLFPYTTLFRSEPGQRQGLMDKRRRGVARLLRIEVVPDQEVTDAGPLQVAGQAVDLLAGFDRLLRSEEHTSELQSRQYLVCRHLLAKHK